MKEIYTDEELNRALVAREPHFIFRGPKADKILVEIEKAERKRNKRRKTGFLIGALAIVAAPFTGGTSLFGLAATTGAIVLSDVVICAIIGAVVTISAEGIRAYKEYRIAKLTNGVEFKLK